MSVASRPAISFGSATVPGRAWYERRYTPRIGLRTYLAWKRTFDIAACLLAMPVLLPVLAACCLAVCIDSRGPIFFFQWRAGLAGRRFRMFKLRTMVQEAESIKTQLLHLNELHYPDFKIANDPRITRVGRILRRSSLDELPQIFNVLRGDMSLVGPRPTSFAATTYSLWHTERLATKPGLTGLWQVMGRNELQFDQRVRLDIAYCRRRSLLLDLEILVRTVSVVLSARGAN